MRLMVNALLFVGMSVLMIIALFVATMTIYLIKQARWETNLKRYKIGSMGNVINPQGFELTTPAELLDELIGIEKRIAK